MHRKIGLLVLLLLASLCLAACGSTAEGASAPSATSQQTQNKAASTNEESPEGKIRIVDDEAEQPENSRRWFAMTPAQQRAHTDEVFHAQFECQKAKGWDIKLSNDNLSIETEIKPEDTALRKAFDADFYECMREHPMLTYNLVYTRKDIEQLYNRKLELAACLNERGVKTKQPPTVDKWVEDFIGMETVGKPQMIWDPYEAFMYTENNHITHGGFTRITSECPNV